jgi:hypothetical protein
MNKKATENFSFKNAAVYRIVVNGKVDASWSERLVDLQIRSIKSRNNVPVSSLIGEFKDQAALSGVLNTLYNMQLTVISVNMLSDIEKEHFR